MIHAVKGDRFAQRGTQAIRKYVGKLQKKTTEAVHLTPSTSGDNDDNTHDEVESSDDIDDEIDDHTELTGLQFDSCLQPKDLSADKEFLLNLAPGEGKNLLVCFLTNTMKRWHFPPFSHLGHLDLIVIARKKYP